MLCRTHPFTAPAVLLHCCHFEPETNLKQTVCIYNLLLLSNIQSDSPSGVRGSIQKSPTVPWQQKKHRNVIMAWWNGLVQPDLFTDFCSMVSFSSADSLGRCSLSFIPVLKLENESVNNQLIKPLFQHASLFLASPIKTICAAGLKRILHKWLWLTLFDWKCFLKSILSAPKGRALL